MSKRLLAALALALGLALHAACGGGGASYTGDDGGGTSEDCARPGDEDGNGAADCDDAACANTVACNPDAEDCENGTDDDDDGDADCADADCAQSAACACVDAPDASTVACTTNAECRDDACPVGESICDKSGASGVAAGHCTLKPVIYADNEDDTGEAADFSCFATPQELTPGTTTTVYGCIDSFGLDVSTTVGQQIEIWRAESFFAGLAAGGPPAAEFGPFTSVPVTDVFDAAADCDYDGAYVADGIPVGEKLVVRVFSEEDSEFVNTWVFNYAIANAEVSATLPGPVAAGGAVDGAEINVAAISDTTYRTIPPLAGLSAGVPSDQGVLAGEIGDCADRTVANAKVTVSPAPTKFSYFNGEADPKPDTKRRTTHVDGLYAALGLPEGELTLNATVLGADGELVDLGTFRGAIFPEAVTILSIRGKQRAADE